MRSRLITVFLAPLLCILLALGGAYAWAAARSLQQEFVSQQQGDLSYFLTSARQALRAENPGALDSEMRRYADLYGAHIAVADRTGNIWDFGDGRVRSEGARAQLDLALSGRRSDLAPGSLPWTFRESTVVEPVFDDGKVIGAVMITLSLGTLREDILLRWSVLVVLSVLAILVLVFVGLRMAEWVLQPMRRLDAAMAAIEHGEMDARIADDTGPPEAGRMIRVFNRMAEEIEGVVSRQEEFVLNASHELRNPLGVLMLRLESLAVGLDAERDDEIEEVRAEARRMANILDTMLRLAREHHRESSFTPVDLGETVAARVRAWRDAAARKQVMFALDTRGAALCATDRTAVESALDAVLDNAVKFAPVGSAVNVTVERVGTQCHIAVQDQGPGLAPEELARVTDRFWRSPRDQNVPGSGLGLAIATDLLAGLGGELRLASPPHAGLRVTLHVPTGELT